MKRGTILLALLILFFAPESRAQSVSNSPKYTLYIDGKPHEIEAGKELKIEGQFSNPVFKIVADQFILFDNGTVSFRYPNYFARQEDGGIGYKSWTLDGNDFNIMLFHFDGKVNVQDVTELIKKKFGKKNCTETAIQKTIGTKILDGTRLNIQIANVQIHQDFYRLPVQAEKMSAFLVFQSTVQDGGGLSEEEIETMKLFNESVKY